jgi:hypothetical protein
MTFSPETGVGRIREGLSEYPWKMFGKSEKNCTFGRP